MAQVTALALMLAAGTVLAAGGAGLVGWIVARRGEAAMRQALEFSGRL